jgi:hypothetical protein
MACGYVPRCALDISDGGAARLEAIVKMIARSRLSIHDISRVQLDSATGMPRFNMPLELGADLGLRLQGGPEQRRRRTLVLDSVAHQYDVSLSDLSGMDVEVHGNDARQVVRHVRDWLNAHHRSKMQSLPGAQAINDDYDIYHHFAPHIIADLRLDPHDELPHADFLKVVRTALPRIAEIRDLL